MILISGFLVASLLVTSCGSKKEQNTEEHEHAEGDTTNHHDEMEMDSTEMHDMDSTHMAYACPMHPEVTGKQGDKCSKCGMTLEAVKKSERTEHEH